jgi:hypothetical protein
VNGRHGRSSSDEQTHGRKKRIFTWLAWGIVVALLGGNLLVSFIRDPKGDKPHGLFTREILLTLAFWVPIACTLVMSTLGLYWSSKAYSQNERSSLLWARRGYVFGLIGSVALILACLDAENVPHEWFVALAAAVVAGQALLFGMMSFKEFRRAQSGRRGRRGRSSETDSAAQFDAATQPPASSPDTGR